MKYIPYAGRAKTAKKPVKKNPKKKGYKMAKKKKHHKKRSNPVKVKVKHHYKKRHNPIAVKKHRYKKRHNPAKMFSSKGLISAAKDIALVTASIIVVSKVMSKTKLKEIWKNAIQLGGGFALLLGFKNPIIKAIGITMGAMGAKGLLSSQWPEYFAGDDEMLIAADDEMMDAELVQGNTASLVSGDSYLGTNNLLRGDYTPAYDASTDSGMAY